MPICASCGQENPEGFRFCGECGSPLAAAQPEHEQRKVVTLLFSDVVGSTTLGERLDPETLRRVMRRYFDAMEAVIERHGGTVEKFVGDAVMAVFGVPRVQEDDALRAVRAADEIRRLLPELAAELGVDLSFRTGINTGEVVVGSGQTLATGDAVNVAARLEQAAQPGEIIIGADTRRLVRDAITCEPLEPLALKGKGEPVPAFRLLAVDASAPALARHLDAPLVGRERELRLLRNAYDRAVDEGTCQLFTLLGMAGAGKSRLTAELLASVADEATIIRGRCLHYGDGITFWPLVEALMPLKPRADDVLARIAEGGSQSPEELFWEVRRLLEAVAAERPLVFVIDDLQWAEPMLLDLVDHVADLSRGVPVVLLCVARPELLDERPGWAGGKLNATTVLLEPLSPGDCSELLDDLAADFDAAARDRIVRASGGNPLFLEEMVALVRDGGGAAVPATIRALLDARIERLGADERAVIERGAVEGEVFHRAAVRAMVDEPLADGLQRRLAGLIRKEMIRPHAAVLPGEDAFRFRHLLIRDAAYDALPKHARADLHERFAGWLEANATMLVELHEIAGWHLEQAIGFRHELGNAVAPGLVSHAADHLAVAGQRAAERQDMRSADRLLTRALALLDAGDERRAPLELALADALIGAGEAERVPELLDAAAADPRTRGAAMVSRGLWLMQTAPADGLHLLDEALPGLLEDATAAGDDRLLARIHLGRFMTAWMRSRAARAAEALAAAVPHARRAGDRGLQAEIVAWGCGPLLLGPAPPPEIRRWIEAAESAGVRPYMRFAVELARGQLAAMDARVDDARAHFDASEAVLHELGLVLLASSAGQFAGRLALCTGDVAEAVRVLSRSEEEGRRLRDRSYHSTTAAYLAEALRRAGEAERAEAMARQALSESAPEDVVNFASAHGTLGLVAARDGRIGEALELARSAVEYAERTDFPIIQAEALISYGDVLRAAGDDRAAAEAFARAAASAQAKGDEPMAARVRAVAAGAPA